MEKKQSGSPASFIDSTVVPGDEVLDLSSMTNQTIKLGGGLHQDCDAFSAMKAGTLRFSKPNKYWVESSQKWYVPCVEDTVLGIVVSDSKAYVFQESGINLVIFLWRIREGEIDYARKLKVRFFLSRAWSYLYDEAEDEE
ncbi:hypothetical protein CRYUN_Cryun19dG0046600 [Craigia yunnanensis]